MAKHYSPKEKRKLYKKLSFTVGIFLIACISMGLILHAVDNAQVREAEKETKQENIVTIGDKKYTPKQGIKTVLFLGNDNSEDRVPEAGNGQSDTIQLIVINSRTDTYNRLTINRNTMTEVESFDDEGNSVGTSVVQICLAYAHGEDERAGAVNVANSVSKLLHGQKIDDYASINMDAIATINHILGGVQVTIEDDFSNSDPSLKMGETLVLSDEQARHFVHDRMNVADGTNVNRIKRQNQYLAGAKAKIMEETKEKSSFAVDFYEAMNSYMITSMNEKRFAKLFNDLVLDDDGGDMEIQGTTKIGEFGWEEFTADQESLDEVVTTLFYDPVED